MRYGFEFWVKKYRMEMRYDLLPLGPNINRRGGPSFPTHRIFSDLFLSDSNLLPFFDSEPDFWIRPFPVPISTTTLYPGFKMVKDNRGKAAADDVGPFRRHPLQVTFNVYNNQFALFFNLKEIVLTFHCYI